MSIMVCILLAVLCLVMGRILVVQKNDIKKINLTFMDFNKGHLSQRFRIQSSNRQLSSLSIQLNHLIDDYQKIVERSEHLERLRKQVISNITHDLRTPLASLLGYTEVLKNEQLSEQEKQEYLSTISKKGESLSQLIDEFFELMILEGEEEERDHEELILNQLLKEEILHFYHGFNESGIQPYIEMPEESVKIYGDDRAIRRILSNLLSNALRYGKEGGEIGVKLWEDDGKAWVKVWDNGKGIKKEDIPYIFERLYTGEQSRNWALQGTGLGLTIVKKLVEQHKGEIFVESQPNVLTSFLFYLPFGELRNS